MNKNHKTLLEEHKNSNNRLINNHTNNSKNKIMQHMDSHSPLNRMIILIDNQKIHIDNKMMEV